MVTGSGPSATRVSASRALCSTAPPSTRFAPSTRTIRCSMSSPTRPGWSSPNRSGISPEPGTKSPKRATASSRKGRTSSCPSLPSTRRREAQGAVSEPRRLRLPGQDRRQARRELLTMLVCAEPVQRVRRQVVLLEVPASTQVDDRDDGSVGVVLDRNCTGVTIVTIHEVWERHDALVANPVGATDVDHPGEISLLRPELGRMRELSQQMRDDFLSVEQAPLAP